MVCTRGARLLCTHTYVHMCVHIYIYTHTYRSIFPPTLIVGHLGGLTSPFSPSNLDIGGGVGTERGYPEPFGLHCCCAVG